MTDSKEIIILTDTGVSDQITETSTERTETVPASSRRERTRRVYSAEILRLEIINKLTEGRADLHRISRQQKEIEAFHDAFSKLGVHLPGCSTFILSNRELSPAIDGMREDFLARVLPQQPAFGTISNPYEDKGPGILARFIAFVTGKKAGGDKT